MQEKYDEGDLQVYELGYHILPTVPEEKISAEVGKIHNMISENQGSVVSEAAPVIRNLAYDIEKKIDTKNLRFNKAYFGWVKFEIAKGYIENIKKMMDQNPEILRFIIIKTVKENTLYTPKAPVFKKEVQEEKVVGEEVVQPPVSEEEIDKSIDELIIS